MNDWLAEVCLQMNMLFVLCEPMCFFGGYLQECGWGNTSRTMDSSKATSPKKPTSALATLTKVASLDATLFLWDLQEAPGIGKSPAGRCPFGKGLLFLAALTWLELAKGLVNLAAAFSRLLTFVCFPGLWACPSWWESLSWRKLLHKSLQTLLGQGAPLPTIHNHWGGWAVVEEKPVKVSFLCN